MPLFALAIFLAAFLLFSVEPLIARFILPWFGGSPAVWSACLCFFQLALLLGYAYAHFSARLLSARKQVILHLALVAAALITLPIIPNPAWKPADASLPALRILLLLAATVGLPFVVLASTSPLLQAWYARTTTRSPYRLFALSNLGSLLALWLYVLVAEPFFTRTTQAHAWSIGLAVFAVLLTTLVVRHRLWRPAPPPLPAPPAPAPAKVPPPAPRPTLFTLALYLLLPMAASTMLLAVTNLLCQDIAVVPFLWIVPLTLYLLTFIIAFDSPRWYLRSLVAGGFLVALVGNCFIVWPWQPSLAALFAAALSELFLGSLLCHGELARLAPAPRYATLYYLLIAAGGALGGLFVALAAPRLFNAYYEFPLGFLATTVLALVCFVRTPGRITWPYLAIGTMVALFLLYATHQTQEFGNQTRLAQTRNFYGILAVDHLTSPNPAEDILLLRHGHIVHGIQFTAPQLRREPTAYYSHSAGIGRLLDALPTPPNRRVGIVGLGAGTLAAYARPGDAFTFYEINPDVLRLANTHFTFLADAPPRPAPPVTYLGDARLVLEQQPPQNYDVLVLDAFSGDAIPVHLLTREAFAIYLRHLAPLGTIAIHCTNRYLDLVPVLAAAAEHHGLSGRVVRDLTYGLTVTPSIWVLLTRDAAVFTAPGLASSATALPAPAREWTDDYVNLLSTLKAGPQ